MYINISCLFLIYVYIYFFQRNSWTSVWHLIVVCPKISLILLMDTSTCPASWYPIHFFNFTTIACPDVSKYLSWMHFGTGLIFGDVWLSHQITEKILTRLPGWWVGLAWSVTMADGLDDVDWDDEDDEFGATRYKEKTCGNNVSGWSSGSRVVYA